MKIEINAIEQATERAEEQGEEYQDEKEVLESREAAIQNAVTELQEDPVVEKLLEKQIAVTEEEIERNETEKENVQNQIADIMNLIACEEQELMDARDSIQKLEELGIDVREAQMTLSERETILKECRERLEDLAARLDTDIGNTETARREAEVTAEISSEVGDESKTAPENSEDVIGPDFSTTVCSPHILNCMPGEYHYEAGEDNTKHAYGQLKWVPKEERVRSGAAQRNAGGDLRKEDDDGGHLIGAMFGGAPGAENLFPQHWRLNRIKYRRLEQEWAEELSKNNKVFVDIYASASNDYNRQDAIYGSYLIETPDGKRRVEYFSFTNVSDEEQTEWDNIEASLFSRKGGIDMSTSEYYEFLSRIDNASSKSELLDILRELRDRFSEDDPSVKELVKKLTR